MVRKDSTESSSSESVAVALHIRPLIEQELDQGCAECIHVTSHGSSQVCGSSDAAWMSVYHASYRASCPQVTTGPHSFTYDHVYGGDVGQDSSLLYEDCVSPLVDGLFAGYNATVFAYGQTGSGKTYTMGSAFPQTCAVEEQGVIPKAMSSIFDRIRRSKETKEYTVKVGFVEIHKEEIKDLISVRSTHASAVHIRELPGGGIMLAGAQEIEVKNEAEMIAVLERGTCLRATGATGMNQRSSRSHAIFTITVEQRNIDNATSVLNHEESKESTEETGEDTESEDEDDAVDDSYLCAKMHLVDLAGSERVKRTKSEGQRLQEGIKINKGLLALGNVINALSENKQHVPYRDSKLTRMLQDSLGGNSRTLMIACVSPADVNLEESLNTLRYASRARAIKNKPVVNRDPVAAQISALRQQLALARSENADLRKRLGISPSEKLLEEHDKEDLEAELESTRAQLARLTMELRVARKNNEALKKDLQEQAEEALIASMQRDKMAQALSVHLGEDKASETITKIGASVEANSIESNLLKKMQNLEEENRRLRVASAGSPSSPNSPVTHGHSDLDEVPFSPGDAEPFIHEDEDLHRRSKLDSMTAEMEKLQYDLEAKEAAIRKVTSHASMQVAFQSHLQEIEKERDSLAKERKSLLQKIKDLKSASAEERARLERMYKSKLRDLDLKVKAAEKKEIKIRSLEATQRRAAQKVKDLEGEIQNIKVHKAMLQKQADKAGKEYVQWKKQRDREVQKLKKENQTAAVRLLKMEAQSSRQQAYLRRKIEEAAAARKRLANLAGRRQGKLSSRTRSAESRPESAQMRFKQPEDVNEWIESELDACCSSIELQKVLEGEKASRTEVARELRQVERKIAALKNPRWWGLSPGGNKDAKQLEEKKKALLEQSERHGQQIQELQLSLMQMRTAEEERGEGAADPKRWESIEAVEDAQTSLVELFRTASKYKTQAYESQSAMNDLVEEVEMLKLKLEVAEAERLEQLMQIETLQKTQIHQTPGSVPRAEPSDDMEVKHVLHELDSVNIISADEGATTSELSSSSTNNSKELLPGEIAVLGHMNKARADRGESPVFKLTRKDLEQHLCGIHLVTGDVWKPGSKSKAEMISDYLALIISREKTPLKRSQSKKSPIQTIKSMLRRSSKSPASPSASFDSITSVARAINLQTQDEEPDGTATITSVTTNEKEDMEPLEKTSKPKTLHPAQRQASQEKKKIWIPTS